MQSIDFLISDRDIPAFKENSDPMDIEIVSIESASEVISRIELVTRNVGNIFYIGKAVGVYNLSALIKENNFQVIPK